MMTRKCVLINALGLASTERKAFYGSDPWNHQRVPQGSLLALVAVLACRGPTLCNKPRTLQILPSPTFLLDATVESYNRDLSLLSM